MMYKPLLDLNFSRIVGEAYDNARKNNANAIVVSLLEKYASRTQSGTPVTCSMVNAFVNESADVRRNIVDVDLERACEQIERTMTENKISWRLASVCEAIESSRSSYNALNLRAAGQVEKLLEMSESDVVAYIKSGALSNVMFCEAIRNVCKSIVSEDAKPISEVCANYSVEMPVTYVDESNLVRIANHTYEITDEGLVATNAQMSRESAIINRMLESGSLTATSFRYAFGNRTYTITEAKRCTLSFEDGTAYDLSLDELKENSNTLLRNIPSAAGRKIVGVLEAIAKVCENYDNIVVVDKCKIVRTNDSVYAITETRDGVSVECVQSKTQRPWSYTCGDIVEALDVMRKSSHIDLNEQYESQIDACINERHAEEVRTEREEIKSKSVDECRNRINALCERYKNDPTKMAILARLAGELNEI